MNGLAVLNKGDTGKFYLTSAFNLSGKFSYCFIESQRPTATLSVMV